MRQEIIHLTNKLSERVLECKIKDYYFQNKKYIQENYQQSKMSIGPIIISGTEGIQFDAF